MLKSANLLHKWGLGDSQSNSTVTTAASTGEIARRSCKSLIFGTFGTSQSQRNADVHAKNRRFKH